MDLNGISVRLLEGFLILCWEILSRSAKTLRWNFCQRPFSKVDQRNYIKFIIWFDYVNHFWIFLDWYTIYIIWDKVPILDLDDIKTLNDFDISTFVGIKGILQNTSVFYGMTQRIWSLLHQENPSMAVPLKKHTVHCLCCFWFPTELSCKNC